MESTKISFFTNNRKIYLSITMNKNSINTQSSVKNFSDEDFEFAGDTPKEDSHIAEVK